jgi:glycosyltransferase involved in cell wall biosynthesis
MFLVVSRFLRKRMTELFGLDDARMAVVGNGVEEAYYEAGAGPAPPPGQDQPPYLLLVGGLTQRKGARWVLALADMLRDRRSPLQLWVVGKGEPQYDQAAMQNPVIRHLGYLGVQDGLPQMMRRAVALLFLSRYETFGIPAAEAMAAGVPPIVSQYAGLPEVVGDGGIVVNAEDPEAAYTAADRLLHDAAYRADWVSRGRERAKAHTWDACADRLLEALRGWRR